MQLSIPQILQLAPDASAAKAGQGLAKLSQWHQLGRHDQFVWGYCQGSGKEPYRAQIDLTEPAFKCSCPSRKFPCKHGLGLLLLFADEVSAFADASMPDWVQAWQQSRSERAQKQLDQAQKKSVEASDAKPPEADAAEQAKVPNKRAAQREARVMAGVQDAMRWLEDLVRTGLVAARAQPYAYWDSAAARLVDAQAPGLARRVRQLPQFLRGDDWQHALLAQLGKLYMLMQAYQGLSSLPMAVQADVRAAIGWTLEQQQLLQQEAASAHWQVMAVSTEQEEQLSTRRTWLQQQASGQLALLLEFSVAHAPRSGTNLLVGFQVQGELVFFPGAVEQRALLKPNYQLLDCAAACQHGFHRIDAFLAHAAEFVARNPWLERSAGLLCQMHFVLREGRWQLRDGEGALLALSPRLGEQIWLLHALAGGAPLNLFGEWDTEYFLPRSYWMQETWHSLPQEVA